MRQAGLAWFVIASGVSVVSCGPSSATQPPPVEAPTSPAPPVRPPPPPTFQPPVHRHPEGAIAFPCLVFAEVEASIEDGGKELRLQFSLTNRTGIDRQVTLHGHCPQGFVTVQGLPSGFDPMHTCQMGACANPEMTQVVTVPTEGKVSLGEARLSVQGDACNPPLPTGPLAISITVRGDMPNALVCSERPVPLENRAGSLRLVPEPSPPAAPPTPTPPAPAPQQPQPARPKPDHPCPICSMGCVNGIPATGVGPDGCPRCGCEGGLGVFR